MELMHIVCRMRNPLLFRQFKIGWLFAYSINFSSLYSLKLNRFQRLWLWNILDGYPMIPRIPNMVISVIIEGSIDLSAAINTSLMFSLLNSLELTGQIFVDSPRTHLYRDLRSCCCWMVRMGCLLLINLDQQIILEKTLLSPLVWDIYDSFSMLNTIQPLSFVIAAVTPIHLPEVVSKLFLIISLIYVATSPGKYPIPMLFIFQILALVFIAISRSFFPHAVTLSQAVSESSLEIASICPVIFTIAMGFSLGIFSFIKISIGKLLGPLSMLQTSLKISFITITVDPNMNTIPLCLAHPPFSNITISFSASPHSRTMFQSVDPLSFIGLAMSPSVFAYTFRLAVHVVALVGVAVWKHLEASPLFVVALPVPFIHSFVVINDDSQAVPAPIDYLPVVGSLSEFFQFEIWRSLQFFEVDDVGFRNILFEHLHQVFIGRLTHDGADV